MGSCSGYYMISRNNSLGAYRALKNDSHTPFNRVSSMINVCICYVIFSTETGNLWWHELSPVGFIICDIIYLCWLQKGSYIIIWGNNSGSSYRMLWSDSHTLIWGVILWCNEITLECISHVGKWLLHNKIYGLVHSECMHSLSHSLDKKENP